MNFRMPFVISIVALASGCSVGMDVPVPSANVGPSVQAPNTGWEPYQMPPKHEPDVPQPKGWRGDSAWGYPPAPPGPQDDQLTVKPVPDMERSSLPDVEVSGTNVFANVASEKTLWVDRHVPTTMRESFDRAATEAAYRGSAVVVDEETGNQFAMSRVWQAGKCSGIDINLLSPGGKLPVISRGSTEICS